MKISKIQEGFLLAIVFMLCQCVTTRKNLYKEGLKTKMTLSFPIKLQDSSAVFFENSTYKINFGKFIIYELPYRISLENIFSLQDSSVLVYDSIKTEYFILDSALTYGYNFKNWNDTIAIEYSKDSFLKNRTNLTGYDVNIPEPDEKKVISKSITKSGDETIHKFVLSDPSLDSAHYSYVKSIDIPVSLSKKLDSTNNLKLYKIQYFYKPQIFDLPDSNYAIIKIEKVPFHNKKEIETMIMQIENLQK